MRTSASLAAGLLLSVVVVTAFVGAFARVANADPLNQNALPISFACDNGVVFTGTGTIQSHTSTGHVIASNDSALLNSVFQAVEITVGGQVVKQIPGFAGRTLVSCTITAFDGAPATGPAIVLTGFFTGTP